VREQRSCQAKVHGIARQPVGTVHNKVLRALDPHRIDRCAVPKKIARTCGEQTEKIYKTIVCEYEPKGYVVACIQGDLSLNLKKLGDKFNSVAELKI